MMRTPPRIELRERVGGISSRLWIWLPATEQRRYVLPLLCLLLASLACAQPLQLHPTTDASLTHAAAWSEPGAAAAGCGGSQAPATCSAAHAIPAHAALAPEDVESVCEEYGVLPLAPEVAARGRVIVDCFMFNNEFDMLLVRLLELAPVVDFFVLVEANVSHSGVHKPALFAHHAHLFQAFAPQLVHVQLHAGDFEAATAALPAQSRNWAWEEYSRAAVSRGLRRIERLLQRALAPSDVVMVADVDEVPRRAFARSLRLCAVPLPAKMSMVFFYYSLRWMWMEGEPPAPTRWAHAFAAPADQVAAAAYTHLNFMRFRSCHDAAAAAAGVGCVEVADCGWHMSFFGGSAAVQAKLRSYAHQEWNTPGIVNSTWIAQALEEGRDLFPRNNHHGQLQPSFVFDALQCGGGGLQQQLATVQRHLPHALSNAAALQRFPSFFPWLSSCAPRTP